MRNETSIDINLVPTFMYTSIEFNNSGPFQPRLNRNQRRKLEKKPKVKNKKL